MKNKKTVIVLTSLALINATSCTDSDNDGTDDKKVKPNVLLVLVDDFGWGHLALNKDQYSHSEFDDRIVKLAAKMGYTPHQALEMAQRATPTLNSLAENGVRFVDAYVSSNVSSPSRAGIITAAYQERLGFYNLADGNGSIDENVTIMPKVMKNNGYVTGSFGKVHYLPEKSEGSMDFKISPLKMGFDYYFGFNYNSCPYYQAKILYRNDVLLPPSDEYLTDQITDETIHFIEANKDKPKLMYVAYNAVHEPLQKPAPDKYANLFPESPTELSTFYSYVYAFDQGIRRIMDKLDQLGQLDNTIIIFLSDNGAAAPHNDSMPLSNSPLPNNGPLRGFKGESWNGGIKTPMIISWGNKLKGQRICNSMVSSLDIFPTVFEAAGIRKPLGLPIDGVSLMPILNGDNNYKPHKELIWMIQQGDFFTLTPPPASSIDDLKPSDAYASFVVRRDNWVLRYTLEDNVRLLYDLNNDKGQNTNLYNKHPDLAKSMTESFSKWYKEMKDPVGWSSNFWMEMREEPYLKAGTF